MKAIWAMSTCLAIATPLLGYQFALEPSARRSNASQSTREWRDRFEINQANLLPTGANPYITMQPGRALKLKHGSDILTVTILPETQEVDGVVTGVLEERETRNGKLVEVSRNFLATDKSTGDVYYFGEDVDNYNKDGKVVSHDSAWRAGAGSARFGLMMPGKPMVGQAFYQEIAPKVAMDRVEVVSTSETVRTPAGTFQNCLHLRETTPLESDVSHKYYAAGIGIIKDDEFELAERPVNRPSTAFGETKRSRSSSSRIVPRPFNQYESYLFQNFDKAEPARSDVQPSSSEQSRPGVPRQKV